jgi:hypothetical protein
MRWRCGDCKGSLAKLRCAPMVHDHIWRAVADPDRRLCEACLRSRMQRVLGRELQFRDLTYCGWNEDYFDELAPRDLKTLVAADLPAGQSVRFLRFLRWP